MRIDPSTRVGALLEAHPELESVLVEISPEFERLRNPLLRKTVARVATLEQAARIAGISPREIVSKLRAALGEEVEDGRAPAEDGRSVPSSAEWVESARPDVRLDAERLLAEGETPVAAVTARLASLEEGGTIVLAAPFNPAPLVDAVRARGHEVVVRRLDDESWEVWVRI